MAPEPDVIPKVPEKAPTPIQAIVATPSPPPAEPPPKPVYPTRMLIDSPKPPSKVKRTRPARPRVIEYTGEIEVEEYVERPHDRNDRNEVERIVTPVMGKVRRAFGRDTSPAAGSEGTVGSGDESPRVEGKQPYLKTVDKLPGVPAPKRAVSASPVGARKRIKSPITARPASATPPGTPLERPGNAQRPSALLQDSPDGPA